MFLLQRNKIHTITDKPKSNSELLSVIFNRKVFNLSSSMTEALISTPSTRKSKIREFVIHDDGLVLDCSFPVKPRLVSVGPNSAQDEGKILIAISETRNEDEEEIDARIRVEEKTADVMQAQDPRRQPVLVSLQAVDEFVDGGGLVHVQEVGRKVADEEGHDHRQEDRGQTSLLIHVELG